MIGISKFEANFLQNCLKNNEYFLTNDTVRQYFPELSQEACYQMIYRLRKKGLLASLLGGKYLILPVNEWFLGQTSKKTFELGLIAFLSSINAVFSGSTAYYFEKNGRLPNQAWEVTTKDPSIRSRVIKAFSFKQKINFHYSKKLENNFKLYKLSDYLNSEKKEVYEKGFTEIPKGYFGVEKILE